jgi:hypothetical protein
LLLPSPRRTVLIANACANDVRHALVAGTMHKK